MLLWLQVPKSGPLPDEDEKAAKLQRQARVNAQRNINILGLVCICLFTWIAFIEQRHYKSPKLRARISKSSSVKKSPRKKRSTDIDDFFASAMPPLPRNSIYNLKFPDITGKLIDFGAFAGKVTLVVNTACLWGKTKLEFEQLSNLHEELENLGFSVLAFPTNDFRQELGTNEEILQFLSTSFPQVIFPVFQLSELDENPVYKQLRSHLPKDSVKHNFFKYLVGRDGVAVKLYPKSQSPESLIDDIRELLNEEVNSR